MGDEKLDSSRKNEGFMDVYPVEVNLVELFEGTAQTHRSFAENKNLFFEVRLPTHMPEIVIYDPNRLTQVLN